jgi:hypothetical protein
MRDQGSETRDANRVSRRRFLLVANSAGLAFGAVGCGVPLDQDAAGGVDSVDSVDPAPPPSVAISDEEAVSLRRQRYRRHALDGLDGGLDDFHTELSARFAADIFTHVF